MSDLVLSERDKQILGAVVEEFVQTAEPVGSRHLTRRRRLQISPATVRNAMADLEEMGYLVQPHTSAGRKPTDRGYRYYVDHLMTAEPVPLSERRRIRKQLLAGEPLDPEGLLEGATRALSSAANQVGVVVAPRFEANVFRRIDFVLLREHRVLVILVSRSGAIHHRIVDANEIDTQGDLDRMANYLNTVLEDLPLHRVREKILAEMAGEKALYDSMLQRALHLGREALAEADAEGEVFVGDPVTLLGHPEFATVDRMRSLFEAFEKKHLILKLLERVSQASDFRVWIGAENPVPDLRDCAVVSAGYGHGGTLGALGVIGPTRMDYRRLVGLVGYVARLVGELLEDR